MHWRSPFIIPVEDVDFVPGTDGQTARDVAMHEKKEERDGWPIRAVQVLPSHQQYFPALG